MTHRGGVSLLTGWLPLTVFVLAALAATPGLRRAVGRVVHLRPARPESVTDEDLDRWFSGMLVAEIDFHNVVV